MKKYIPEFLTVAVIVVLVFGYFYYEETPEENLVACTKEALICPDGSGVGRTGPKCQFSACPAVPEGIVGILEQSEDGFRVVLDSGYILPIELRVSNALENLVGKPVRAFGQFTEGNTLKIETLEEVK